MFYSLEVSMQFAINQAVMYLCIFLLNFLQPFVLFRFVQVQIW